MESRTEVINVDKDNRRITGKWWDHEGKQLSSCVFSDCMDIQNNYSFFYRNMVLNEAVYNANPIGWNTGYYNRVQWMDNFRLNRNCTAAICDTLVSKICKNTPTVQYLTKDGDWHLQKRAKDLSLFIQGRFQHEYVEDIATRAFLEGVKNGTSGIICRWEDGNVKYELIRPQQIRTSVDCASMDESETYHFVFYRNRYTLAKKYFKRYTEEGDSDRANKTFQAIMKASNNYDMFMWDRMSRADEDVVPIVESYSTFKGRRTVCIEGYVLEDEDWDLKDELGNIIIPVAWFNYKPGSKNLFGKGLIEEIRTIQWEMDKILRSVAKATHLVVVPKMLVHTSANVKQSEINNEIARLNWQAEIPPAPFQMGQVPKDYYEQLEMYCSMMYEISGLSELSATSQKPAGLDSGKALETFYNIESDRFQMTGRAYEELYLQLNDLTIRILNNKPESSNTIELYYGKNFTKQLKFKDVDIDRDQIRLQAFVMSNTINTPAGQAEYAQQLMSMGVMDRDSALQMLDLPDMAEYTDIETSELNFIKNQMCKIADGYNILPEINQNLDLARSVALKYYFDFRNKGLSSDRLNAVANYLTQTYTVQVQQSAQQQVLMQMAQSQQAQQLGAQNGTNPSTGTQSGLAIAGQPTNADLRAAAGQQAVPQS